MSEIPPAPPDPPPSTSSSQDDSSEHMDILPSPMGENRKRPADTELSNLSTKKTTLPSNSIQGLWTHPSSNVPYKYTEQDNGPFIVHVHRAETNPRAGTTINRIQFGKIMVNSKIGKIAQQGIKNVGRNRISMEFLTPHDANNFISNPLLNSLKFKAIIPTFNITRMGIARDVPTDWTMDEFVSNVELPPGCGEILKARRFNRKLRHQDGTTEWCPSTTVVLTFSGQILPKYLYCYFTSIPIEPYILPTIQCFSCCRFGHVVDKCRSKPRCFKCGQGHTGNSCTVNLDNSYCCLCTGYHFATDKNCPEFGRQKLIKKKMSEDNISYSEAATLFPPIVRSYSDVARKMFSPTVPSTTFSQSEHPSSFSQPSKQPIPTHSTRKRSIYSSPRTHAPLTPGYDRAAHQALIAQRDPPVSQNGVALRKYSNNYSEKDNLIEDLFTSLINILSKYDTIPTPPNVAHKLTQLNSLFNKIPFNSVE